MLMSSAKMARPAKFQVDPRLAMLLGATYRSSEQAIQELVDNAWDADAENVWISLPEAVTSDPVVVRDDGSGMTEPQVRNEYLKIARDRRATKGIRTPGKNRLAKGRKGIGKFAGLMMAGVMRLETRVRGQNTSLTIRKEDLQAGAELEALPLAIEANRCESEEHGTEVILSALEQQFNFPSRDRLKDLLVMEYGREEGFRIIVNDIVVGIEDVRGTPCLAEATLPTAGFVRVRLRITEDQQAAKQAGVVLRIGGKIIGRPSYFGLDQADDVPLKVLRRVYGEVEADGLSDDVAGNGLQIVENSKGLAEVETFVRDTMRAQLLETCNREMNLAKARIQQDINRSLEKMPEYRRDFARRAIERIMQKFYEQPEDRVRPIISVVLDAMERDEYWQVLDHIDRAKHGDVTVLADALHEFGVLELAMIARQARHRLGILDQIDALISNPDTLEQTVHTALVSSNRTLARTIDEYTSARFSGDRAKKRPDLLLLSRFAERHILIEFKRPSATIGRPDVSQAEQYRDELTKYFSPIGVWVIGGEYDTRMLDHLAADTKVTSYGNVINRARQELAWLLQELGSQASAAVQ
jgi:hypothetical protein